MTDDQAKGIVGAVESVSSKLITNVPAQLLILVLLNVVFILSLIWFLDRRDSARERLLAPIIAACLVDKPP